MPEPSAVPFEAPKPPRQPKVVPRMDKPPSVVGGAPQSLDAQPGSLKVIQKPDGVKDKPTPLHMAPDLSTSAKPEPIQMPPSFKEPIFGKVGVEL